MTMKLENLRDRANGDLWAHPELAMLYTGMNSLEPFMYNVAFNFELPFEERKAAVEQYLVAVNPLLTEEGRQSPGVARRELHTAPGCPEEPETESDVIIYRPEGWDGEKVLPVLFVVGGGGMFTAGIENDVWWQYADRLHCAAVCTRYRGCFDAKYPAPINDLHATYAWMVENANELKVDADKVVVIGMSAGTNIALSLCYRLKRYGFRPRGCVVEACFTDPRPIWPTSTITAGANWNAELMWRSSVEYLGVNNVTCFDDPEMYPIYAKPEDAVGLCPTFLHPDSEEQGASAVRAYCDTLSQAGVYHECHVWGGTAHAILRFSAFAGDAALIRGSDEGVEKNEAADSYSQRFLSIVDGNIRDCWNYDLRRAFTVELASK